MAGLGRPGLTLDALGSWLTTQLPLKLGEILPVLPGTGDLRGLEFLMSSSFSLDHVQLFQRNLQRSVLFRSCK